jgi:CCR4-NOT transcription complex subunit 7/8
LSQELGIQRTGRQHQAGSDSLITSEVFFKLINEGYLHKNIFNDEKNLLFGISPDNPIMDLDNNQFMMNFGLGQSQPTYSTNVNDLNINNRNIETNTNTNPNPTSTLNTYQPYQPYFQNIHTQDTNHNRYYGFPNQAFSFARNRDNEEEKGTYGWN